MNTVAILGRFADKETTTSGQIIKTRIVADALCERLGVAQVKREDTQGIVKILLRLPYVIIKMLSNARHVVIMPAERGLCVVAPSIVIANVFFHRRLHYVVIGGGLPHFIKKKVWLHFFLNSFHCIYVETRSLQMELEQLGFQNVYIMSNCKPLNILSADQLPVSAVPPFRLCTFSRVIKEKGIEDAVRAVRTCNEQVGKTVFTLDIYGQVEQRKWFDALMADHPDYVAYRGIIPFNRSTDVLKDYFALLFPTYYAGEAFAGTLIDAMSAGLPVIASDWHNNSDIVIEGETGLLFPTHSVDSLVQILYNVYRNPQRIVQMRPMCLKRAEKYQPSEVIQTLLENLK